jgi:hypothetical protein
LPDAPHEVGADGRRVPVDAGDGEAADTGSEALSDAGSRDAGVDVRLDAPPVVSLCGFISPETFCVSSYADCVTLFSHCVPAATPPPSELTLIPDPVACAAALESDNCRQQGEDYDYFMPASCAVCPPPWQGDPPCPFNTGDAG